MAHPWTVGYDRKLTVSEHELLERHDELFSSAFMASHFWKVETDRLERRHIRALGFSDRTECLAQFVFAELEAITDEKHFKGRIIAGDFACSESNDTVS